MTDKEIAKNKIAELIERFGEHIEQYKKGIYNETQTRADYIDPFFEALGWDIYNKQGNSEAYRDVILEDKIKVGEATKAPDYCFTLAGTKKFFVEAKKPSVNIKGDILPAYQVRRYGWSAKLAISIVTDFEEFAIYDCNKKPNLKDKASVCRIKYMTYTDYIKEFDFIYETFAKKQLLKGSFDKYIQSDVKKRGTTTVDNEFLKEIETWRKYLAVNFALRNKQLTEDEINYAVQKTIDRIIFLRICEDRNIEKYGRLKNVFEKENYYKNLCEIFDKADKKYNSGLFDFKKDKLTQTLSLDNKVVKNIITQLYYPDSPYEFSVFPVDILGHVYERFLGKTIRLTPGHYAKIEEKPEVRKAGGVYYTPNYIVDYIVENTVGKLIKNKTPKQIEKIKICDPACGSGSFLIGAYQYLLDYHLKYYTDKNFENKKNTPLTPDGNLTTGEKKRILLNNIYGVDIDSQAVEVTKLNLLLKELEGETKASINTQLSLFNERVLPSLNKNIKCGNSLIGTDFYDTQATLFPEQIKKINAFDWKKQFPEIFENQGFDVVIGNPPYLKERGNKEIFETVNISEYGKYHQGKMDFWYYFLHKAIDIVTTNGIIGFITNSYWIKSTGATKLIKRVRENLAFTTVIDFDKIKIFESVSGRHMIHIYSKTNTNKNIICNYIKVDISTFTDTIDQNTAIQIKNSEIFSLDEKISFEKINDIFINTIELGKLYEVSQGCVEATDKISFKALEKSRNKDNFKVGEGIFVLSKDEIKKLDLTDEEKSVVKRYLNTNNVDRYSIKFDNEYLLYTDKATREKIKNNEYPNLKNHLDRLKEFITSSNKPYGLHRTRKQKYFESPKLICKGMFSKPKFCYDNEQYYVGFSFSVIIQKEEKYNLKILLGLLNSKAGEFWFNQNGKKRGVGVDIGVLVFRKFPIPEINFSNPKEKQIHDTIVQLVDNLLYLNKELHKSNLETQQEQLQRAIKHSENKIDEMVYELYGLNEEEIRVVENKE